MGATAIDLQTTSCDSSLQFSDGSRRIRIDSILNGFGFSGKDCGSENAGRALCQVMRTTLCNFGGTIFGIPRICSSSNRSPSPIRAYEAGVRNHENPKAQSLGNVKSILGGSGVAMIGVISPLIWVISIVTLLKTHL